MNLRLLVSISKLLFKNPSRMLATSSVTNVKDEVLQDPYNLKVIKRGEGTKSQPNEISSASEARIVGCVCEIDSYHVKWMWIHSGEPKYYYCGSYWFKLVYKEALK